MTTGILLLHGSSGTPHLDRVAVLSQLGADVVAPQWFDQSTGICEIPLESFLVHLDALAARVDRLCVMGTSKGAEAALLLGTLDDRIDAVLCMAPAAHVWAALGRLRPPNRRTTRGPADAGGLGLRRGPSDHPPRRESQQPR
jgi:hypothetical protein